MLGREGYIWKNKGVGVGVRVKYRGRSRVPYKGSKEGSQLPMPKDDAVQSHGKEFLLG